MLKFQCLVLDHDDTVVRSTATVNYPGIRLAMQQLRPELSFTAEQYAAWNFSPGFQSLLSDIWKLTPEEQAWAYDQWLQYAMVHMPPIFGGFDRLLQRHHEEGGKIAVISHSSRDNILRDYRSQIGLEPDLIFGWDLPAEHRKPHPYPLEETMRRLSLPPEQLLMVDDLKPGLDMARACGVLFTGAGWGNDLPQVEAYLRANSDYYFKTVDAFEEFLFG